MNSKYKTLVKDTFIFALGNIGSKIILFLLVPLYTACMTQEQYGTADLLFTVAQLVSPVVSIVIFNAVVRFGLAKDENPEDVLLSAYIVLGIGAAVTLFLPFAFAFYEPIAPWRWQISAYVILLGFYQTNMNYLKVKNKNIWYAGISLIYTALMAVLNIIMLAVLHLGVDGYLWAYIISIFIAVLFTVIIGRIPSDLRKARFKKSLFVQMLKFSVPLILNDISWWVVHSSDKVMLERMMDVKALGVYTVSSKIPAFINVIINIFIQAWGLSSIREYEDSNDSGFYSSVLNVYTFLSFGATIVLVAFTKPFMRLYVSADFYEAWKYVPILLVAAAFASIAYFYGSLYAALKKSVRNMVTTLIAALVNIAVNYIGIILWGIYGAAVGTLAAYIVMSMVRMLDVGRYIKIKVDWARFCVLFALVTAQSIFVTLDFYGYIASAVTVIAFAVLYRKMIAEMFGKVKKIVKKK